MKIKKCKKGMTLVETLVALVIMSLGVVVMARLTQASVQQQESLDSQYSLVSIDAVMSDIYHDFHSAEDIKVNKFDGLVSLVFDLGDGVVHLYDWVDEGVESITTPGNAVNYEASRATFYVNGVNAFKCSGFDAEYNAGNLFISILVDNDKRLEMNVYR